MGGETYRPSERNVYSPPRSNNHRTIRSPHRYGPSASRAVDRPRSRSPRRRSRSPALRGNYRGGNDIGVGYRGGGYRVDRGGSFRGRARSPPHGYSPRRDAPPTRSPPRSRRFSGSPMNGARPRSPFITKRGREPSPIDDFRQRSPPFAKRERFASPTRERFERRAHSPPRDNGPPPRFPRENNYRPAPRDRSRSPVRRSEHVSRVVTPISSRRSSPPIHPDRLALAGSGTHSPPHRSRQPLPPPSPIYRDRSPPRPVYTPQKPMSPMREQIPFRSPPSRRHESPPRERHDFRNDSTPKTWSHAQMVGPPGHGYPNGLSRGPPNGPSGPHYNGLYFRHTPSEPPSAPISMSAHNRPSSATLLSAPTRPRGGLSYHADSPRGSPYGGPPHRRGHPGQYLYHGPPRSAQHNPRDSPRDGPRDVPPSGPRAPHPPHSIHNGPAPFDSRPPFRSNNSSSTTYPRTQRFSQYLPDSTPSIVLGGKLAPSGMDAGAERRLAQLEEDKRKLLEQIEEKQKAKRAGLREWDKTERETKREGLKSELAEGHLERITGEGVMTGAAF